MDRLGGSYQLILDVVIEIAGQDEKSKVLIDMVARTWLIRRDLFPNGCFRRNQRRLLLRIVNGDLLAGGSKRGGCLPGVQREE